LYWQCQANSWTVIVISAVQQLATPQATSTHRRPTGPYITKFKPQTGKFVQCMNVQNNHWITVSTVGCTPHKHGKQSVEAMLSHTKHCHRINFGDDPAAHGTAVNF